MKDKFIKNGVFSLEYDKETLRDMVLELQEVINKAIEYINKYESIRAYYEYIDEDGYDEYNCDEDFKNERLMMSKEEVINRAKELLNENQEVLITKYMFLEQQCKKQKEVIDKAIEWVRDWTQVKNDWFEEDSKPSELLDILNEVTNNE